jgi:hypothetical protein
MRCLLAWVLRDVVVQASCADRPSLCFLSGLIAGSGELWGHLLWVLWWGGVWVGLVMMMG